MSKFLLLLILASFSTYRLARLITIDTGPFGIFFRLREALGAYDLQENGEPTYLGEMVSCPYCMGIYISLFILPLIFFTNSVTEIFLVWMGIAGIQSFLQTLSRE